MRNIVIVEFGASDPTTKIRVGVADKIGRDLEEEAVKRAIVVMGDESVDEHDVISVHVIDEESIAHLLNQAADDD